MKPERWQQLKPILQSALELAPDERDAFLDETCAEDAELRREAESFINAHEQATEFIENPAVEAAASYLATLQTDVAEIETVGSYRIIEKLGEGGMGAVYLAMDTRLGRRVALKMLHSHYSTNADPVRRFQQEARAASALNHPNILTIYEIGQTEDGKHFIASEFVKGEMLRQKLQSQTFSLSETLEITIQIAAALSAAHEARIVHRDIKPENVMLRPDGYIKVLDFGLAKLVEQKNKSFLGLEESTTNQTAKGVIMGTVNYMSPEQAKAEKVDERTDIFSLGVLVYEMIAGRTPFADNSMSETFANLINQEPPPLTRFVSNAPNELQRIVSIMLKKNRAERYQTMNDVLTDLRNLRENLSFEEKLERSAVPNDNATVSLRATTGDANKSTAKTQHSLSQKIGRHKTLAAFALIVLLIGTVSAGYYFFNRNEDALAFQLGKVTRLTHNGNSSYPAISPDGKFMAYVLREAPHRLSIHLMNVETGDTRQLFAPNEYRDLVNLAFSPDGNYIYFAQSETYGNGPLRGLYRISELGGVPTKLLTDFTWYAISRDGRQLAFGRTSRSTDESLLMIANADGTGQHKLAARKLSDQFTALSWSPNGQAIASIVGSREVSGERMGVVEVSLADGAEREITSQRWNFLSAVLWLADGNGLIVSGKETSLMLSSPWHISYPGGAAQKLSPADALNYWVASQSADSRTMAAQTVELQATIWITPVNDGGSVPATTARQITTGNDGGYVSFMPDGRLLFTSANSRTQNDIWVMKADGTERTQLTANAGTNTLPSASADGCYIVFESDRAGKINIWRMDADGGNPQQLTFGDNEKAPDISPDGKWVFYTSADDSTLWRVPLGGGAAQKLTGAGWWVSQISPDGKWILSSYREPKPDAQRKPGLIPFDGGKPVKMFELPSDIQWSLYYRWTPDGQAFIFVGVREGVWNVWKQPIEGGPPVQLTDFKSTDQIYGPNFSPDGQQLVFSRGGWMFDIFLIRDFR